MAKKLFVPDRYANKQKAKPPVSEVPKAIAKGFESPEENKKNTEDPSSMGASAIERLPNPVGYRLLEKSCVLMGRYAGNRFKVDGLEVRLINDDNVIATILDPADISYV